jgi:hypothetical protein
MRLQRTRRASVASLLTASLAGLACGPDLPERLWRSEHVRYFSREADTDVCPAILDDLEAHGQVIADALGIERTLVSYYKFDGLDDFEQNAECGSGAACAPNATVRSPVGFDRHELVHAYLAPYGRPPWLLTEGAAAALSCQRYPRPTGSWRDAYVAPHSSPTLYGAGAWLVGHLLNAFPALRFLELYARAPSNATADEFAELFQEIYMIPLDEVWAAAIGGARAPMHCPWECSRPAFVPDGQPHALVAACGVGNLQLSVDLPDAGLSSWRIEGEGRVMVQSCDGNEQPLTGPAGGEAIAGALLATFAPGKYFVNAVVGRGGGTPTLTASVDTGAALSGVDCVSAPALPADLTSLFSLVLFYPSSTMTRFTSFATGITREGRMQVLSDDPAATVALCASCETQTQICSTGDRDTVLMVPAISPGAVLAVPGGAATTAAVYWF